MQLYDQMLVRHGIMLVGPTGGGKTVSRNILQKALTVLPTFLVDKNEKKDKEKAHLSIVSINFLFILCAHYSCMTISRNLWGLIF